MKALVPVKRVVDSDVQVRPAADGKSADVSNLKMAINPFDEIAVEQAVRMKETGAISEVIAVSIGPQSSQETIRTALAMGADRGIHVLTESSPEPLNVAKLLKALCEREAVGLALLGKQATDDDCNQTGQMLSALLGWSQATFASSVELNDDSLIVRREVDSGTQTLRLTVPAVITADLRLNVPRNVGFASIVKAKRAPVEQLRPEDLDVQLVDHIDVLRVEEPPRRNAGVILESADDLVKKLRYEAGVI